MVAHSGNAMSIPTECCTKISELMKKKIGPTPHVVSLEREIHEFYNGAKPKKIEIDFLGQKPINIVLEYTKRCGKATFGGFC